MTPRYYVRRGTCGVVAMRNAINSSTVVDDSSGSLLRCPACMCACLAAAAGECAYVVSTMVPALHVRMYVCTAWHEGVGGWLLAGEDRGGCMQCREQCCSSRHLSQRLITGAGMHVCLHVRTLIDELGRTLRHAAGCSQPGKD